MPLPCCRRIQVGRKEERVRHSGAHDPHGCVLPLPCSGMPVFTMPRVVLGRKAHMAACGPMLTPRITAPFSVLEACLFPKVPSEHVANEKRSMGPACGINGDLKTKHVRVACLGAHACACRMIPSPRWRSMPQEPWTTMSVLERFLYLSKPRRHTPQSRSQRSHLQRNRDPLQSSAFASQTSTPPSIRKWISRSSPLPIGHLSKPRQILAINPTTKCPDTAGMWTFSTVDITITLDSGEARPLQRRLIVYLNRPRFHCQPVLT